MHILRVSFSDISLDHIEELVRGHARENEVLEFKSALPVKVKPGEPQVDRWIEHGDRVGDYARDKILQEIVAFANANGGTLVLGVKESNEQPREAIDLLPLPKCEQLAQRLLDVAEDVIEPRLPTLFAKGIPSDDAGNGFVVLRTGRSRYGPHRLKGSTGKEFYVRRGERAATMDVREIKNLTLELARSDDRLEVAFQERRDAARDKFLALRDAPSENIMPPLLVRVTALPTLAEQIESLTSREDLWWRGLWANVEIEGDRPLSLTFPMQSFGSYPRVQLRTLVDYSDAYVARSLHANGLVEAIFTYEGKPDPDRGGRGRVYVGWLLSLLVGTLAQIEHLRRKVGWETVEYGLELEIWSKGPIDLHFRSDYLASGSRDAALPLTFPRYSIRDINSFNPLIDLFLEDTFNSWGKRGQMRTRTDWEQLIG